MHKTSPLVLVEFEEGDIIDFEKAVIEPSDMNRTYPGVVTDFLHTKGRQLAEVYAASANMPAWQPHYDLKARYHLSIAAGRNWPALLVEMDCLQLHQGNQISARGMVWAPTDEVANVRSKCVQFRAALECGNTPSPAFMDVLRVNVEDVFPEGDWTQLASSGVENCVDTFLHRYLVANIFREQYQRLLENRNIAAPAPVC